MPFILWVIRAFRWVGPTAARLTLRSLAPSYLASLKTAADKSQEEQVVYKDTLKEAGKYPSALRRLYFEVLKNVVEETVWAAFVAYARRVRETDPELRDVADDAISI